MPTVVHQLDSFLFLQMTPPPPKRVQRLMVETRAGVDGVAIWKDALRGTIYRPTTVRDVSSHTLGQLLKDSYEGIVGADPVALTYANVVYPQCVVKDVMVTIDDQVIGIGGFNATVRALVRAQWEIIIL